MEIGRWNGHVFEVSTSVARGFTDLTIKGSAETEEQTKDEQKLITRKSAQAAEVSLTAHLYASLGCRVREEAMAFVAEAQAGACDYLILGGAAVFAERLMLTSADVQEIAITPSGVWTRASVALTLRQSDGTGADSKGNGGGGKDPIRKVVEGIKEAQTKGDQTSQLFMSLALHTDVIVNQSAKAASLIERKTQQVGGKAATVAAPTRIVQIDTR